MGTRIRTAMAPRTLVSVLGLVGLASAGMSLVLTAGLHSLGIGSPAGPHAHVVVQPDGTRVVVVPSSHARRPGAKAKPRTGKAPGRHPHAAVTVPLDFPAISSRPAAGGPAERRIRPAVDMSIAAKHAQHRHTATSRHHRSSAKHAPAKHPPARTPARHSKPAAHPAKPVSPANHVRPVKHVYPVKPADPVKPVQPVKSGKHHPVKHVYPVRPEQPVVVPVSSVKPVKHVKPIKAMKAIKSVKAVHPLHPIHPVHPVHPHRASLAAHVGGGLVAASVAVPTRRGSARRDHGHGHAYAQHAHRGHSRDCGHRPGKRHGHGHGHRHGR